MAKAKIKGQNRTKNLIIGGAIVAALAGFFGLRGGDDNKKLDDAKVQLNSIPQATATPAPTTKPRQVVTSGSALLRKKRLGQFYSNANRLRISAESTDVKNKPVRLRLYNQAKELEKEYLAFRTTLPFDNGEILAAAIGTVDNLQKTDDAFKALKNEFDLTKKKAPKVEQARRLEEVIRKDSPPDAHPNEPNLVKKNLLTREQLQKSAEITLTYDNQFRKLITRISELIKLSAEAIARLKSKSPITVINGSNPTLYFKNEVKNIRKDLDIIINRAKTQRKDITSVDMAFLESLYNEQFYLLTSPSSTLQRNIKKLE